MDLVVKAIENSETLEVLDAFATSNCWLNSRSRYLAIRKREDYLLSRDKPKTYYFGSKEWFETIWGERELPEEETHQDEQEVPTAEDENTDTTTPHLNTQVGHGIEENISDDPKTFYEIREEYAERVKRFRTEGHTYRLQFQNLQQAADIGETAIQVFNEVLDKVAEDGEEDERIGLCIRHPALESAILVPFRKREEISGEAVLAEIERVQQSNKELDIEEEMRVTVTRVKLPGGSGRDRQRGLWQPWHNRHMVKGGCFITINNNDNLCCARAIVTGIASLHKDESPEAKKCYDVIRQGDRARCTAQRKKAEELMDQAGLKNHKGACGLDELKKLQEAVKDYQLKVFWKENFNKLWFKGPEKEKVISLYLHDDHYDVITSVAAFFGRSYFCHSCDQVYEKREEHRCEKMCRYCYRSPPCMGDSSRHYCTNCNRYFPSIDCFNEHQRPTSITIGNGNEKRKIATSICRRFHCCRDCGKLVNQQKMKEKKHTCYETYCNICKEYMPQKHQCYMKKLKKREENEKKQIGQEKDAPKFIIFDFECQQCEKVGETELGPTYLHKVNYCIAHKVCDSCKTRPIEEGCSRCGPKRKFDFKTLEEFCSWLFGEGGRGSVCFAHNMKGYDGQFLLQFLHKQGLKPDIIMRGLEILCLKACSVEVKCSYNFLQMPLSALPKAFGLKELKKGYFPHLFNTPENENYTGPLPDKKYYQPDHMKPKAREEFLKWYEQQTEADYIFNFQTEFEAYCNSDVTILREALMKFRDDFIEQTAVDPLLYPVTLPSACSRVYRQNDMPEDTIAIIPEGGYRKGEKQSIIALKWLRWMAEKEDYQIQDKLHGGEKRINGTPYRVDGYVDRSSQNLRPLVFEFHGCAWHGCSKCYSNRDTILPNGLTAFEAYEKTVSRRMEIALMADVEEKWECELKEELKKDQKMKEFFTSCEIQDPLDPRDAFCGGRTNATKLYQKPAEGETIKYFDVCSLYPYTNKYQPHPVGVPKIITEDFEKISSNYQPYKGLMKCKVLPPRKLLHPVLPYKTAGKLLFPLCKSCCKEKNQESCNHSEEEKAFWGTWCTNEIDKALQLGYEVLKIVEVWHFEEWSTYNGKDDNTGLFTKYVNQFLKIKVEASGWPGWVKTDEDREKYIKNYKKREGITLDKEKIETNPGLRSLAKLCLNSFWGKFGQRQNLTKTEYFTDPQAYFNLIGNEENEVLTIKAVSENMVMVNYQKKEEFVESLANVNAVLAAFTTSHARLTLYSYLEKLNDRVLYFDTDSVIFLTRPGDTYMPATGDYLGDMTDELPGSTIREFIGCGPKQYCITSTSKDHKEETILKIRGFTLSYNASNKLHREEMKRMVDAKVQGRGQTSVELIFPQILRLPDHSVVTKTVRKVYRVVCDKRRVLSNYTTLPYGYVD